MLVCLCQKHIHWDVLEWLMTSGKHFLDSVGIVNEQGRWRQGKTASSSNNIQPISCIVEFLLLHTVLIELVCEFCDLLL